MRRRRGRRRRRYRKGKRRSKPDELKKTRKFQAFKKEAPADNVIVWKFDFGGPSGFWPFPEGRGLLLLLLLLPLLLLLLLIIMNRKTM